jgi:hypothetical protein
MTRRAVTAATGALVLGGLVAAPTVAQTPQTTVSGSAKVSPSRAGTKARPQGVKLTVKVHWETVAGVEPPVVQSADVMFPKGSLYNGGKYPKCSENVLARKGLRGCPSGAIMGKGSGVAFADTVLTYPKITVVNGGKKHVYLYTVLNNPARVQAPVPGTITKAHGKWAYKLHLEVPHVLQLVAGVPIALRDLTIKAGKKSWLATTACPGGKWPFSVETAYDSGTSSSFEDSVSCKKH